MKNKKEKLYTIREITDLKDLLSQSENLFSQKEAFKVREKDGTYKGITYSQFKDDVDSLGTALVDLGLNDAFVSVIAENRYEWCVSYLAVANGTGVVVPIDKELPEEDVEYILSRSSSSAIIFSLEQLKKVEEASKTIPNLKYFICMDSIDEKTTIEWNGGGEFLYLDDLIKKGRHLKNHGNTAFIEKEIDAEKMSILIFTSGTTGFAKGVMISHKNISSNIMSIRKTVHVDENDSSVSILPLHHTYECTIGFLCFIYSGATIAFNESLRRLPNNLKTYKPSLMVTVPLLLESVHRKVWEQASKKAFGKAALKTMLVTGNFLNKAFKVDIRHKVFKSIHDSLGGNLRMIIVGAAAIDPEVSKFFRNIGISVLQGYGLTECSPLVAGNRDSKFKDSAAGVAIPDVEIRIDNPDEKGVGEIVTRGDNVMLGYFEDEEATAESLRDGWFYTGDIGKFDKNNFLYITGRIKNVIVTKNGKNIYPEELEASINRLPIVLESMVWGEPDSKSGDIKVHAQILPNLDAIKDKVKNINIPKEEITKMINDAIKNINKGLPLYKRIKDFSIRDSEFIKTTTRKIKRHLEKNQQ